MQTLFGDKFTNFADNVSYRNRVTTKSIKMELKDQVIHEYKVIDCFLLLPWDLWNLKNNYCEAECLPKRLYHIHQFSFRRNLFQHRICFFFKHRAGFKIAQVFKDVKLFCKFPVPAAC